MKKTKLFLIGFTTLALLSGCGDEGKHLVDEIKYDLSLEYDVPISEVEVKTIEYGSTIFTTNQFEVSIASKEIHMRLIEKNGTGNNFTRVNIK